MKDTIPIPIKEDGTYDIEKQRELADKYEQIEEIKKNISQKIFRQVFFNITRPLNLLPSAPYHLIQHNTNFH